MGRSAVRQQSSRAVHTLGMLRHRLTLRVLDGRGARETTVCDGGLVGDRPARRRDPRARGAARARICGPAARREGEEGGQRGSEDGGRSGQLPWTETSPTRRAIETSCLHAVLLGRSHTLRTPGRPDPLHRERGRSRLRRRGELEPVDALGSKDLAGLLGELVLDEDLVAGGDDLGDRREVARTTGGRVADEHPDQAEGRAVEGGLGEQGGRAARRREEREDQPDEQSQPQAGEEAAERDPSPREPGGDALDLLEVGADDEAVLDRELLVGQGVHGLLRICVLLEDTEGQRVVQGEGRESGSAGTLGCRLMAPSSHFSRRARGRGRAQVRPGPVRSGACSPRASRRPMIIRWMSAVPSPMSSIGASR